MKRVCLRWLGRYRLVCLALGLVMASCGVEMLGTYDDYNRHVDYALDVEMPPNANFISQQFSERAERGASAHNGTDVWGLLGTPILAAAPGTVVSAFYEPKYGNQIEITHGRDTNGDQVSTIYKHLKTMTVNAGDTVARGQQIATMGATGVLGMMVHLHFEVRRTGTDGFAKPYDPMLYWVRGPGKVTCFEKGVRYPATPFRTTYPVICKEKSTG